MIVSNLYTTLPISCTSACGPVSIGAWNLRKSIDTLRGGRLGASIVNTNPCCTETWGHQDRAAISASLPPMIKNWILHPFQALIAALLPVGRPRRNKFAQPESDVHKADQCRHHYEGPKGRILRRILTRIQSEHRTETAIAIQKLTRNMTRKLDHEEDCYARYTERQFYNQIAS